MSKQAVLTEYNIFAPRIKEAIKIALVSDLHERRADDILSMLSASKPDIIAVAGDTLERYDNEENKPYKKRKFNLFRWILVNAVYYVNEFFMLFTGGKNQHDTQNSYEFLRKASAIAPVYLSLGNHEEKLKKDDYRFLEKSAATLLDNADTTLYCRRVKLRIGGLSSFADEKWLDGFSKKDGYKILLCHHPEYYDSLVREKHINLILSGHNHGGQVRIFGKGLINPGRGFFPKYDRGVFENRLVVSTGCSNTAAIPRWNNPRELVIVSLTSEEK